ncbi:hypothetical protein UlMin_029643 [Ulmus minor]
MAEGIVSSVLLTLARPIIQEAIGGAKLLFEVRDKVEDAKGELRMIRGFLKDADARAQRGDETVRLWVLEITDAAFDLEDVVATSVLKEEAAARKRMVMRFACLSKRAIELHEVGSKIDGISKRISKLTRSLQTYGVKMSGESSSNQRLKELRQTYAHVPDHDFVGFGKNIKELVEHLTNPTSGVVSICGMGGLGKTTLAKEVYHRSEVKTHFNCFVQEKFGKEFSSTFFLHHIKKGKKLKRCQTMK